MNFFLPAVSLRNSRESFSDSTPLLRSDVLEVAEGDLGGFLPCRGFRPSFPLSQRATSSLFASQRATDVSVFQFSAKVCSRAGEDFLVSGPPVGYCAVLNVLCLWEISLEVLSAPAVFVVPEFSPPS